MPYTGSPTPGHPELAEGSLGAKRRRRLSVYNAPDMPTSLTSSKASTINSGDHAMARPPIHPGEILANELAELQISAAQLSRKLHVPTNRITQILAGKRAITADTALRLGQWFGTGPELWLNLQKSYELRLAEQEVGQEIRQTITPRPFRQAFSGLTS